MSKWINIKDRIPLDRKFVIVKCPSGYTTIPTIYTTARLDKDYRGDRWIDWENDMLTDSGLAPTHWRPFEDLED